jgi:N-acetylglutamate synthase-like GNAT family acetyltransferase
MKRKGTQFAPVYQSEHGSAHVSPGGYVSNVHIRGEMRGQGHGTALMQRITSDADRLGQPLSLHARPDLHGWYRRLGFEQTESDALGPRLERKPR